MNFPYKDKLDSFSKNIILVFAGTFFGSFLNLVYQLIIAHRLSPADFASFNSLLAIFMMLSTPIGTLQAAVAKYGSEFAAKNELKKAAILLSCLFKKVFIFAIVTFCISYFMAGFVIDKLNIPSPESAYIMALMLGVCWMVPVFSGIIQGLEMFNWLMFVGIAGGILKLILVFIFLKLGFNVSGALAAFLLSLLAILLLAFIPVRKMINFKIINDCIRMNELFMYLLPVMLSNFCYLNLVSFDIVLVKYFFSADNAGIYSLGQMLGKIFLFLPGAINVVMFPRVSYLKARNSDTSSTLKRSLIYGGILCAGAILVYNLMPDFILRVLVGKAPSEAVALGRIFGVSMSLFALLYIFISYFLSLKDFRFIKYLVFFAVLQIAEISVFHASIFHVQFIIVLNAVILLAIHAALAYKAVNP